ncbi:Nn.00g058420.m01.CDS01 [Neocucurbitaria sp. VM-36]
MKSREILIVGATGQQGGATIAALTALPPQSPPIRIMALTRFSDSPKAQALQKKFPEIALLGGDVANPSAIFTSHPNISSIFLVTVPPNDEEQAIPLIEAAITHGIPHIVLSSVDRGGEEPSWTNPTTIPHFAAKHRIELHLREACLTTRTQWTILRPAGFIDNYTPGFFGKMMAGLWATMPADRKMQLVSVHDIGMLAAEPLVDPDSWVGRAVGIAGDDLTFQEGNAVFRKVVGYDMPKTWGLMSRGVRWGIDDASKSMDWFERVGFGVDIEMLRRKGYEVQSFEDWLRTSGHWIGENVI